MKKEKPKKPKKNRKKLVKELDNVFSLFIRARDKRCVVCGTKNKLTCGHLFSRVAYSTRWHELNSHAQCRGCNMRHEYDFYPYQRWFVGQFGEGLYDYLYKVHKRKRKFNNDEIEQMTQRYQKKLLERQGA